MMTTYYNPIRIDIIPSKEKLEVYYQDKLIFGAFTPPMTKEEAMIVGKRCLIEYLQEKWGVQSLDTSVQPL